LGYADSPLLAFTDPPLTTIRQSVDAMSTAPVSTILAEIDGTGAPHTEMLFTPDLIVRDSTAAAPQVGAAPEAWSAAGDGQLGLGQLAPPRLVQAPPG